MTLGYKGGCEINGKLETPRAYNSAVCPLFAAVSRKLVDLILVPMTIRDHRILDLIAKI